jgi:hypothetical protein
MGRGDEPLRPGRRYVDWALPDPKGRPLAEVRATREEIGRWVGELVAELDATRLAADASGILWYL